MQKCITNNFLYYSGAMVKKKNIDDGNDCDRRVPHFPTPSVVYIIYPKTLVTWL